MFRSFVRIYFKNSFVIKDRKLNLNHHKSIHTKSISKIPEEELKPFQNHSSLTVSYLINSCGLSPQSALIADKKINIKTTENPDRFLDTLKSYGFNDTHITKLIARLPELLLSKVDVTIKPKLDYYTALGHSRTDLGAFISGFPSLLWASLDKRVKPNFELLRPLFDTDQQVAAAVRRSAQLLKENLQTNFFPNVRTMQSYGVPGPNIAKLITLNPRSMMQRNENLKMVVRSVMKLGLDPLSGMFVRGVYVMSVVTPSTWKKKVDVYKSHGWSEAQVMLAFTKQPNCMFLSVEKIRQSLEFFADRMQWGPSFIAARPVVMNFSMEKRIIPRFLVMNVLVSKGLVSTAALRKTNFLKITDKSFADQYMAKYVDQVPEGFEIYRDQMQLLQSCFSVLLRRR